MSLLRSSKPAWLVHNNTNRCRPICNGRIGCGMSFLRHRACGLGFTRDSVMCSQQADAVERPSDEGNDVGYKGQKAVIIGGGPSGMVAATLLARQGFDVKVFEKRSRLTTPTPNVKRSIIYLIRPSITEILLNVGLDCSKEGYTKGMHKHSYIWSGSEQGIFKSVPYVHGRALLVERHSLTYALMEKSTSGDFERLKVEFDADCEGVSVEEKTVYIKGADGSVASEAYDLLIGADGGNSTIRAALQAADPSFSIMSYKCGGCYKSLRDLPEPKESDDLMKSTKPGSLLFMVLKTTTINGECLDKAAIVSYRTEDGFWQVNLSGTPRNFKLIKGNEEYWLKNALPHWFPKSWYEPIIKQLQENPESVVGSIRSCSSMIGPSIALIGDAAHTFSPAYGVGANMAIAGAFELCKALESNTQGMCAALQQYNAERQKEAYAIHQLEKMNPAVRLEENSKLLEFLYQSYIHFHMWGNKILSVIIPPPVTFRWAREEITAQETLSTIRREIVIGVGTIGAIVVCMILQLSFCVT